jgi:hypothetical protein
VRGERRPLRQGASPAAQLVGAGRVAAGLFVGEPGVQVVAVGNAVRLQRLAENDGFGAAGQRGQLLEGVAGVFALAEVIDPPYSALVLLGTFGSLRWAELTGLRRKDIDLAACTIRVERKLTEMPGGGYAYGAPKSDASVRTVSIPNLVVPRIRWHLSQFTKQDPEAPVFTAPTGTPLRHGNFRRRFWLPALKAAGLPTIHFHDLGHTGNTLRADAGANLRELMERMGHSTTRAALVYLHSTSERQRAIADAVDKAARATLRKTTTPKTDQTASGTKVARRRDQAS